MHIRDASTTTLKVSFCILLTATTVNEGKGDNEVQSTSIFERGDLEKLGHLDCNHCNVKAS